MKNRRKNNLSQARTLSGFNLIELIVTMGITTTVIALASQALVQTQNNFSKDQRKVSASQKMSSVLEIVGREIRQAGEFITDTDFPTIQVIPLDASPNPNVSLVVYRAVSSSIPMCNTTTTRLSFAISNSLNTICQVPTTDIVAPSIFPAEQQTGWIGQRVASGGIGLGVVPQNPLPAGTPRVFKPFVYRSEYSVTGSSSRMDLGINIDAISTTAPTGPIAVGSNAYLVIKKEYLICQSQLIVRTNSQVQSSFGSPACAAPNATLDPTGTMATVATDIAKLNVNMITRIRPTTAVADPPEDNFNIGPGDTDGAANGNNTAFPITAPVANVRNWQNIQGVIVSVVAVDPESANRTTPASFIAQGNFYPRNALSTR
jgi:type II secretory pathway pseudopilin PulG